MALLLTYRLLSETPEQVTYAFGTSPEDMTGLVNVDPREPDREATGEGDPRQLQTVAGRVTLRRLREGTWPGGGAIQS
jgi:hypothetical protein